MVLIRVYIGQKWTYWKARGIDGPPPSLMKFGNLVEYFEIAENRADYLTKKYGDMFGFYTLRKPVLYLNDIKILKEVNIKQFSKFNRREPDSQMNSVLGKVTKDFMTSIDGSQWKRVRQSTVPLMTANKLSEIIPLINKAARTCCSQLSTDQDYETKI